MEMVTNLFNTANTWLTDNFGDLGPLLIIGVLGMFLILLTLPIMLKKEKDPFDQLKNDARASAQSAGDGPRLRRGNGNKNLPYLIGEFANNNIGAASATGIFAVILANIVAIFLLRMVGKTLME